jgi:hypothetical protein
MEEAPRRSREKQGVDDRVRARNGLWSGLADGKDYPRWHGGPLVPRAFGRGFLSRKTGAPPEPLNRPECRAYRRALLQGDRKRRELGRRGARRRKAVRHQRAVNALSELSSEVQLTPIRRLARGVIAAQRSVANLPRSRTSPAQPAVLLVRPGTPTPSPVASRSTPTRCAGRPRGTRCREGRSPYVSAIAYLRTPSITDPERVGLTAPSMPGLSGHKRVRGRWVTLEC